VYRNPSDHTAGSTVEIISSSESEVESTNTEVKETEMAQEYKATEFFIINKMTNEVLKHDFITLKSGVSVAQTLLLSNAEMINKSGSPEDIYIATREAATWATTADTK